MSKSNFPEQIHVLASAWTFAGRVYERGDVIDVTPQMYELTIDRTGVSFLDHPEDATGWGVGPAPAELVAEREAVERQNKLQTLAWMRRNNPGVARALSATRRIAALEDELMGGAA